ncbi:MAG TPA: methyltransferase domain-containing protein [Noviherbaspirillum sp.]|uniref:methyltransferase domain-containing protein n=1 Tax=Noviherbaspirillum sp. TaxID=1926288 RepID=UPI002B46B9A1|nr:methyltransferase domain-containing protein [Noviherbaspirillum sp.]HJV87289.1 methyltransferase domain-containing protein [Noviherbaspirillum sp.]
MPSQPTSSDSNSINPIDIDYLRRLFGSPDCLADSEFLRREIARRMHERLPLVKIKPERVLDLGCGTGNDLPLLQEHYPDAQVLGLDASPALLSAAYERQRAAMSSMNRLLTRWLPGRIGAGLDVAGGLVCGDFGQLPFKNGSMDVVWSNLALHWHPHPDKVFAEWRRVLRVDGLLMFSCFGPDTLKEIRSAFSVADRQAHALSFVDMHDFGDMLINAGFSTPVMDMETITVTYESVNKLLSDVRAWGGNPLATRRRSLFGRRAWAEVTQALEQTRRDDGKLPLTFEIVYGHAFRPTPTKTSSGESIIRLDFRKK